MGAGVGFEVRGGGRDVGGGEGGVEGGRMIIFW